MSNMRYSFEEACNRLRSTFRARDIEPQQWDYVLQLAKNKLASLNPITPVIGVRELEWDEKSKDLLAVIVVKVASVDRRELKILVNDGSRQYMLHESETADVVIVLTFKNQWQITKHRYNMNLVGKRFKTKEAALERVKPK